MDQQRQRRQQGRSRPVVVVRREPRPRATVRWSIILVPLAILFAAWVISGIEPAGTWKEVMGYLHVRRPGLYSQLACLGIVVVAAVAIARVLGHGRGKKE